MSANSEGVFILRFRKAFAYTLIIEYVCGFSRILILPILKIVLLIERFVPGFHKIVSR